MKKSDTTFSNHIFTDSSFLSAKIKIMAFRPVIAVPVAKVNPYFMGVQVQASGFAENLHLPRQLAGSIFCKKPAHPNTTSLTHQNNNDRPDGKTHNFK